MNNRNRIPLYTYYSTSFLSITGNVLASLAIPWFVLQTTGSAAQTGLTAFFSIMPVVIGMTFGGALVDRVGYKQASIIADVASGLTVALVPLLYMVGWLPFPVLLALVFLGALLDAPGNSARSAMMPESAALAGVSLERASSITATLQRATTLVGAPLAGLLIVAIGAVNLLWFNAVTFFISAVGIWLAIPNDLITGEDAEEPTSYWDDLKAGFSFVRNDTLILTFIGTIMLTNMMDVAALSVVLPVYADEIFGSVRGPAYMGFLLGAFGGGAVIGNLLFGIWGERLPRRATYIFGFASVSLYHASFVPFPPFWVLVIVLGVVGFIAAPINPIISTVMYERVPINMRARVFGLLSSGVQVAMPFGALAAGYLIEGVGLRTTVIGMAAVYVSVALSMLFLPVLREMNRQPPATEPPTAVEGDITT